MPTGIEEAGLVLAILPLVIEAAKWYMKGVDSVKDVMINSRRDESLQDFYEKFWWESYILHRNLKATINSLVLLCDDCKVALLADCSFEVLEEDNTVRQALLAYFGEQQDLDDFLYVMMRVLDLIDRLTKVESNALSSKDKKVSSTYSRLKQFVADRKAGSISSTFFQRFRFFKDKKKRDTCVKNLKTWNKRLDTLVSRVQSPQQLQSLPLAKPSPSLDGPRKLFGSLIKAIENHWSCSCQHQAMLSLRLWPMKVRQGPPANLEFEFLLAGKPDNSGGVQWFDTTFLVESHRLKGGTSDKMRVDRFCSAVNSPGDGSLKFLVETASANQVLWQLRSTPKRFCFLNNSLPRSLRHVLSNGELTALRDRRTLALKLVYASIQYYGSTYIQEILEHDSIFFHPLTQNAPNFDAPFVVAPIPAPPNPVQDLDMGVQYPCSSLLTLGIRILEIHKGKPLEFYLTDTERQGLSPNTKLAVAWRLYHNLDPLGFRGREG